MLLFRFMMTLLHCHNKIWNFWYFFYECNCTMWFSLRYSECCGGRDGGWCVVKCLQPQTENCLQLLVKHGWGRKLDIWVPLGLEWAPESNVTEAPQIFHSCNWLIIYVANLIILWLQLKQPQYTTQQFWAWSLSVIVNICTLVACKDGTLITLERSTEKYANSFRSSYIHKLHVKWNPNWFTCGDLVDSVLLGVSEVLNDSKVEHSFKIISFLLETTFCFEHLFNLVMNISFIELFLIVNWYVSIFMISPMWWLW